MVLRITSGAGKIGGIINALADRKASDVWSHPFNCSTNVETENAFRSEAKGPGFTEFTINGIHGRRLHLHQ